MICTMGYERTISESSDDIVVFPLELTDLRRGREESSSDEEDIDYELLSRRKNFSAAMGVKRKKPNSPRNSFARQLWQKAVKKALAMTDPWERFHLDDLKTERAVRHRYNALNKKWVKDEVFVKLEDDPFNHGAMRACYRMKKLSNFSKSEDWKKAHNYVAKKYMDETVDKTTYFTDVKLQMDAKLWGEEYNRHNPPKKVDIFQMAIIELVEREGKPLYHVEHFLEGKYVKYNSNSGFVKSDSHRLTPQVFSHFTFERSGHELIIVDIQGVGDLYTDPQIHTANGTDYGDGNLGTRGMALFFHSHMCNSICKSLGLTQFDLADSEISDCKDITKAQKSCKTVVKGSEEHVILPTEQERGNIQECIRLRSISSGYMSSDEKDVIDALENDVCVYSQGVSVVKDSFDDLNPQIQEEEYSVVDTFRRATRMPRIRYDSTTAFYENSAAKEDDLQSFKEMVKRKSRPSKIISEEQHMQLLKEMQCRQQTVPEIVEETVADHGILGQIHLDLAKYHEIERFIEDTDESYDKEAAFFHLERASSCQNLDAVLTLAKMHRGMPHDILADIELEPEDRNDAFKYLFTAANLGDRGAMIDVAKMFDSGDGLPYGMSVDWNEAIDWYERALNRTETDHEGNYDSTMDSPSYLLYAREAEMYLMGGHNLNPDPNKSGELFTQAAEAATEAMKGKLATKYFMKAEEAWAECPEE